MTGVCQRFTPVQRLLHWLIAICILAMLFIGVGMVSTLTSEIPRLSSRSTSRSASPSWPLALIRLAVRLRYGAPALPADPARADETRGVPVTLRAVRPR